MNNISGANINLAIVWIVFMDIAWKYQGSITARQAIQNMLTYNFIRYCYWLSYSSDLLSISNPLRIFTRASHSSNASR